MYVAVKGGERAIKAAHALQAERRRGDAGVPELSLAQIRQQLPLAVDRVMAEGALWDPELAALAIKQAAGDLIEAVFLLRAHRTTLTRVGRTLPVETAGMAVERRISAIFKDLPGGQRLGPTFDYSLRLLDPDLAREPSTREAAPPEPRPAADESAGEGLLSSALTSLLQDGLIEAEDPDASSGGPDPDITRTPLAFPASRPERLQALARGDEGYLLALGYSTQRGYGRNHPFAGEIRRGQVAVSLVPPELGFAVEIGDIDLVECQLVNQFKGSATSPPQFTRGYGLSFGGAERKAMSMALVDRALRAGELGEAVTSPAQDQEFVLSHADNVEASGFTQHLKLPHHVDFQSELELIRSLRRDWPPRHGEDESDEHSAHAVPAVEAE